MDLKEWTKHFIDARYIGANNPTAEGNLTAFEYNGARYRYVVSEHFPETIEDPKETRLFLVTLNTSQNALKMVKMFPALAELTNLTIIFCNPNANQKWLIKPKVHAFVADKTSLKAGIMALFETVPPV